MILRVPKPGTSTFRSRGSDMIAVACLSGSRRTSRIVSERGRSFASMSAKRRSEPSSRIVCGAPSSTSSSTLSSATACALATGSVGRISLSVSSTSSRIALATAIAENTITSRAPTMNFFVCWPSELVPSGLKTLTPPANLRAAPRAREPQPYYAAAAAPACATCGPRAGARPRCPKPRPSASEDQVHRQGVTASGVLTRSLFTVKPGRVGACLAWTPRGCAAGRSREQR